MDYSIVIVPLSEEDGGGWMGYAPDLPGCMSDGETPEEAAANTRDAIAEWLDADRAMRSGKPPVPGSAQAQVRHERDEMIALVGQLERILSDRDAIEPRRAEIEERIDALRGAWAAIEPWSGYGPIGPGRGTTASSGRAKRLLSAKG